MIARIWSARTTAALCGKYLDHFAKAVRPMLATIKGYTGAMVTTRESGSQIEVVVTTFWQSLESIDSFAGIDREAAVVAPEAAALLTDFDKRVKHYELAFADLPSNLS